MKKIFFLSLLMIVINTIFGQVVVNEYSASNLHSFSDNYSKTNDWIELYNTSSDNFDLSGYHLSDKHKKPGKWKFPNGTMISGNGYMVIWCSGRDEVKDGHYHTNFKLSQTKGKDKIIFSDPNETILEEYAMKITLVEHSNCRTTDGADEWRVCTSPTPGSSNNNSSQVLRYTVAPSMDLEAGFYDGIQTVSIQNNEPNSVLRYTIDGKNPTESSPEYTAPISVSKTTIIKARSFSNDTDIATGKMDFNTYFIDEDFSVAVFSVGSDIVEDLANGNGELIPVGSLEYFNLDKEREAISYGDLNRHGKDSWALPHRSIDWASRDEMGYNKAVFAQLFSFSERDEYQKFMFRNSGDDNYPAMEGADHEGSTHIRDEFVQTLTLEGGMHLDTRAVERAVLFLNGKYWGLYGLRDRPVDHDYTKEYYKQGKYDLHFLTTWGSTEAQYGGEAAFDDWEQIREFILNNDMSIDDNYKVAEDQIDLISFSDYFIANQAVVAKDWLNYNTAWWRGLDEDEKHTKWGYLLWDMDATFDYYINYTGVPNDQPDAKPCDINEISDYMDVFFSSGGGSNDTCEVILNGSCPYTMDDPNFQLTLNTSYDCCYFWSEECQVLYDDFSNQSEDTCATILNGSCPYTMDDIYFKAVISTFDFCCTDEWNNTCQEYYDYYKTYQEGNDNERFGNFGKHEKLLIKLLDENKEFKQLYFSRYTDLMNTVYSCENMNTTLDRMLDVIIPEMPKQIERWGGTLSEWEGNVEKLKTFINARCMLLDDGMIECFDELSGPYKLTLMTQPAGIGSIKLNTLKHDLLPWSGDYFGGMENKIKASLTDDEESKYKFDHWESTKGNIAFPDITDKKTEITVTGIDTLIAVFVDPTGIEDFDENNGIRVYPNPTSNIIHINYELNASSTVSIGLYNVLGEYIADISSLSKQPGGKYQVSYDMDTQNYNAGMYIVKINIDNHILNKKISLVR